MIIELIIHHRAVEGGISTLMSTSLNNFLPAITDNQSILEMAQGTEDIHLQMKPLFAAFFSNHHHRITIGVLLVEIAPTYVLTLGVRGQFTIDVHPCTVIRYKSLFIKCRPVDKTELFDRLGLHIGIGTL